MKSLAPLLIAQSTAQHLRRLPEATPLDYLVRHPYYPSHDQSTCLDSRITQPPEWMTLQGGYAENHLFATSEECCARWGFDCDVNSAASDGDNSERPTRSDATAASVEAPLHSKNNEVAAAQLIQTTPPAILESTTTFPTMSCGSSYEEASQCQILCLSGAGCPSGQSCHASIPCPSSLVAAAMGDTNADILNLIAFDPDDPAADKRLRNVCGSSYEDAESSCIDGYTEEFVSCDLGAHQCPAGREICYSGLICPLPPTTAPSVRPTERPSTMVPTQKALETMVVNSADAMEPIDRKDKTDLLGVPIVDAPPPAPQSTSNASPYTIDKSTLGSISVAATSCSGGCPQGSTCVGNSAGGQAIKDEECTPCAGGQTWWPCDVQGLCWCWLDGTDRIAPAPESGIDLLVSDPHYTVCDDILTQQLFDQIAPDHQHPYSYTGLCDAILSYNAHHAEKAFGMGDAFQRAAELAAFLGNTLHESDEFRAGREYLMCADRIVHNDEVYCKPCDSGSFDWGTFTCPTSLISAEGGEFNEYCQPSSVPPEACSCGDGKGGEGELKGYVAARDLFFGRGAIQLSWNYNYIGASIALTGSPDTFCENPDLVATEPAYAWGAGLFFWMEHSKEGTTCHTESLMNMDFGGTLNNINGGLECPAHGGWHEEAVKLRLNRYCRASKALGLPNLMTLSRCAGLEEKMTACLADGSCSDCQDYVGTSAGAHPTNYSPPVSAGSSTAIAEPDQLTPEETLFNSLCGEGLMALPGRRECCVPNTNFIGDGACDPEAPYNTAECLWDGGDCCKGTCKTDSPFGCKTKQSGELGAYGPFGFYCLDPSQGEDVMFAECTGVEKERIGDGKCNPQFNTAACNYDGGDCCEETCDKEFGFYPCETGQQSYDCIDPRFKAQVQTTTTPTPTSAPTKNPVNAATERPTPLPVQPLTSPPTKRPLTPTKSPSSLSPTRTPTKSANSAPLLSDSFAASTFAVEDKQEVVTNSMDHSCPSDFKECPNTGIFVGRDPDRGCRFRPCEDKLETLVKPEDIEPEMPCPSDFKECSNGGIFVSRNPLKNCRFNPCPDEAAEEEKEEAVVEYQAAEKLCPSDFKECQGTGIFVSRDPSNNCHFKSCPKKDEMIEADPDKHQFSSMIEAAMQGKKTSNLDSDMIKHEELVLCPQDVRECSDGSFVSRDPSNNCKFEHCKEMDEDLIACPEDVRECRDGTFVGRDPSNECQFRSCTNSIASQNGFQASQNTVHSKKSIAGSISESLGGLHHKGSSSAEKVEAKGASAVGPESDTGGSIAQAMAAASRTADVNSEDEKELEPSTSVSTANAAAIDLNTEEENEASDSEGPTSIGALHGKTSMHQKGHAL